MTDAKAIEAYWEDPNTVSLLDTNLRALEESVVLRYLDGKTRFADLGCGGGESTVRYAARAQSCVALERSQHLRAKAAERFAEAGLANVELVDGSVEDLSAYRGRFDVVATQRVLINIPHWTEQQRIIENIHSTLANGGCYVMVENTYEGWENLNAMRRALGLGDIKVHWHNNYLHHDLVSEFVRDKFAIEKTITFDLYYLLTRVYTSMFASFEGYGAQAKADPVFKVADAAARQLFEAFGDRVSIARERGASFGPIQGMVLRKIS